MGRAPISVSRQASSKHRSSMRERRKRPWSHDQPEDVTLSSIGSSRNLGVSGDPSYMMAPARGPHTTAVSEISEMTEESCSLLVDTPTESDISCISSGSGNRYVINRINSHIQSLASDAVSGEKSTVSDMNDTNLDTTGFKSLKDVSCITGCSDYSIRDHLSRSAIDIGPLHSTMNTAEDELNRSELEFKEAQALLENVNLYHQKPSSDDQAGSDHQREVRPSPMGSDSNRTPVAPVTSRSQATDNVGSPRRYRDRRRSLGGPLQYLKTPTSSSNPSSLHSTDYSSLDESTPIVIVRSRSRRQTRRSAFGGRTVLATPTDSGSFSHRGSSNTTQDTPSTTTYRLSRDEYLSLNEDGSRFADSSDTAEQFSKPVFTDSSSGDRAYFTNERSSGDYIPSAGDEDFDVDFSSPQDVQRRRQPGVGTSRMDIRDGMKLHPGSELDSTTSSMDATRDSEANPSSLTLPSMSDITMSSIRTYSSISGLESSSYKESDANTSSPPEYAHQPAMCYQGQRPQMRLTRTAGLPSAASIGMSTDSMSEPCAPVNSLNSTDLSSCLSSRPMSSQHSSAMGSLSSHDNLRTLHQLPPPDLPRRNHQRHQRPACVGKEELPLPLPPRNPISGNRSKRSVESISEIPATPEKNTGRAQLFSDGSNQEEADSDLPMISPIDSDSDIIEEEGDTVPDNTSQRSKESIEYPPGLKKITLLQKFRKLKRHFRSSSKNRSSDSASSGRDSSYW